KPLTLSNVGTVGVTINGLTYSNPEFSNNTATSTCGTSLAAGANCTINLVITHNATAAQSATLTIISSDPAGPTLRKLNVTCTTVTASPTTYIYTPSLLDTLPISKPLTLSNVGTVGVTINGLTYSNPEFSNNTATSTCGTSLAAGANCTINLV